MDSNRDKEMEKAKKIAKFVGEIDPDERPPDNPPVIKFHDPTTGAYNLPEELRRRVFGTPPPPNSSRPIPPPPPPPNSYHKKPKYWQMRGTSHMQIPNRAFASVAFGSLLFAFVIDHFCRPFIGYKSYFHTKMTPEEKLAYDQKNEFYLDNTLDLPARSWYTNLTGDQYQNPRAADKHVRWDLREVDLEAVQKRDFQRPIFDDDM